MEINFNANGIRHKVADLKAGEVFKFNGAEYLMLHQCSVARLQSEKDYGSRDSAFLVMHLGDGRESGLLRFEVDTILKNAECTILGKLEVE